MIVKHGTKLNSNPQFKDENPQCCLGSLVCLFGYGFGFLPADPSSVFEVCVFVCPVSLHTPILPKFCGVFVSSWPQFVVCVFGYGFCSHRAVLGLAVCCVCLCLRPNFVWCRTLLEVLRAPGSACLVAMRCYFAPPPV